MKARIRKMNKAIRSVLAAAAMAAISTVHGAALPRVGSGTDLNTWTRNFSGVLAAAKTTGHPILLVMVNNSSSGDGCSHCKMFEERTLNSAEFASIVRDYRFYMVLLNYWGIDQGTTQPDYGGVPYSVFWPVFQTYNADGGFPVVSVIRPDGRRYKSWGDGTNPGTRGTLIHQYIRAAIADLAVSGGTSDPTEASTPATTPTPTPDATPASTPGSGAGVAVTKVPRTYTRETYACFRFSAAGDVEACALVKLTSVGGWRAKLTEAGHTTTLKGKLKSFGKGGYTITSGNTLNITFDTASGTWSGTSYGRKAYGRAVTKADARWKGLWNSGVGTSASSTLGGWVTAKVANSGQTTFSGSIANRYRLTGRGYSAVFPAAFVSANIPKWAGHGDVRFVNMGKVDGGYALCADGTLGGRFTFKSITYDLVEGSKWSGGSISALNGAAFRTTGGGNVVIPVTATANRLSATRNGFGARISATPRSGLVRASYTSGGSGKASGVLYLANGTLKAAGGGRVGQNSFVFVIQ